MELNPIVQRDLRARWRNWRAFGLIFVYAALLAGIMGWQYANLIDASQNAVYSARSYSGPPIRRFSFPQALDTNAFSARQHLAYVGLTLFRNLNTMQLFGWMLIAPALTAASIAGERERGLLEALQLSYLSAARIVGGKLLCAMGFLILMLLIPLPIMAVCFTLGGISPGEFMIALALQIATAITCALIGLAVSAWSRRVNIALTKSFLYVLSWGFGTSVINNFLGGNFLVLAMLNPITVARFGVGRANRIYIPSPTSSVWSGLVNTMSNMLRRAPWATCISFEIICSLFLLWLAVRGTRKSLDTPHWIARQHWVDRLKRYIPQPDAAASATTVASAKWKQRARHALWWEFPLISLLRFSNPILQREARNKLRWRGTGWKGWAGKLSLGFVGAYYYINWFAMALYYEASRAGTGWQITYYSLGATIIASAVLGASAIPREREAGTWESVSLSLLPKRQILSGKVVPPLLACLLYSLPLWPLIIACTDFNVADGRTGPGYYGLIAFNRTGIIFIHVLAALLIIATTAWGCTTMAMLISWRFQRASAAVSWTLGIFLLLFVALPALISATHDTSLATLNNSSTSVAGAGNLPLTASGHQQGPSNFLVHLDIGGDWRDNGGVHVDFDYQSLHLWRYVHPLLALGFMEGALPNEGWNYYERPSGPLYDAINDGLLPALGFACIWLLGGLITLTILHRLMRDNPRQADANQRTAWRYAKL